MRIDARLRGAASEIFIALRRPDQLVCRWRDRAARPGEAPDPLVFAALLASAIGGIFVYGLTMGLHLGVIPMLVSGTKAPVAAGTAWVIALPALYVIHSARGGKIDASTTLLAALTTVSFGALAMLASVPINWFFTLALPFTWSRVLVSLVVFSGVGFCMSDVFLRVMRALEPERSLSFPVIWLMLLGVIGTELMLLLDLFAM